MSRLPKPMASLDPLEALEGFQMAVVDWFRREAKSYPWRETKDPYAILVSEIMLQQTQVATVLGRGYYTRWMSRFPSLAALAAAPEDEVLKAWEGLGYYRRARHLRSLAQLVMNERDGCLPDTEKELLALPGIGRYTAGAILSFAHDRPVAMVDANVQRVLARLFDYGGQIDCPEGQRRLWGWAERLVPKRNPRLFNGGLMELGQTLCRSRGPACIACPVSMFCATRHPETLPKKARRRATVFQDEHVAWVRNAEGEVFLCQESGNRRQGLWKLPSWEEAAAAPDSHLVYKAKYSITHYRVTLHVHECSGARWEVKDCDGEEGRWFPLADLPALPMPAPYRKALESLLLGSPL